MNKLFITGLFLLFICQACKSEIEVESPVKIEEKQTVVSIVKVDTLTEKANEIMQNSIEIHGGDQYDEAYYQFEFRKKVYTFQNLGERFRYTVDYLKNGQKIKDILDQGGFERLVDGLPQELSEADALTYGDGLNSVIYFATLPHKLKDKAVIKTYRGEVSIKDDIYHVLEISFDEFGGGTDHDDQYYYWLNQETGTMDYFAYNYSVNGGGVRFRSAYNAREIEGVRFQDYINYEASVGTTLDELPSLYEKNSLKELSIIALETIVNLEN